MPSKIVAILLALSASRALCSTFDIVASPNTFNYSIMPTSTDFSPIPYNVSVGSISPEPGQQIVMLEFDDILLNAAWPFSGIFWGFALPNVTDILLAVPDGPRTLDVAANYSTACSNATTIFNSTLVFMNCLQLGFTSVLLDGGVISLDEDGVQATNSYLNFGDIRSFNGSGVLDDITTCISSTCQNTSTSTCSSEVTGNLTEAYDPKYNVTEKLQRLFMGFHAYCDGQTARPNSDVLGPGVLVASLTQSSAVFFFFLASKFHRWTRWIKAWIRGEQETDAPTLGPQADSNSKPGRLVRALALVSAAAESIVVDFHEAQIFFVLTIQIATFWFFNQKKVIENSNTYAEAGATFELAVLISFLGIGPVFLGQTVLQRSGRHWWYTTLLTSITAVVAWVLFAMTTDLDYAAFWIKLKDDNPISQCGGNPSPNTYCGVYNGLNIYGRESFQTANKELPALALEGRLFDVLDFVTIWAPTFLFVDQLFVWIHGLQLWDQISRFCKRVSKWDKLYGPTKSHMTKIFQFFLWVIWIAHQSLLVISLVPLFTYLLFIFHTFTPITEGWSYGQLIASLIWAPLGLKLVYYTFFGVEKGIENRIGGQFKVQGKHDTDSFATKAEKVRSEEDIAHYTSVTDLRNETGMPREDWQQRPIYTDAHSPMHHARRKPSPYFPIPQEYENLSYMGHSMSWETQTEGWKPF
ncbi:hypothetical protein F5Y09DRAFT_324267 [Xylaria sp. FL1042]|nr:hypothetical protein F5Y09DRAFT_324267 [Xylaria sp. FL1042]